MIDREKVKSAFRDYTNKYNADDDKIKLKIDHTYRVAELSDRICDSLDCSSGSMGYGISGGANFDKDVAWLIAMLHDIGRFEQVRRYGTFSDAESVDHAELSADLLFKEGLIREFLDDAGVGDECKSDTGVKGTTDYYGIIEKAIRSHNKYRIPEDYDEMTLLYARIIRDADKIDILKVNVEIPQEVIYNITTEELRNSYVSDEVMKAFNEEHCVLRSLKQTPVDNLIGHLSLIFELEFPISFEIVKEQGYYLKAVKMMEESENPKTRELTDAVRERMDRFIAKSCSR